MNNEELNTALYKKLFAEQDNYRAWLLAQPPEEILNHAYEYAIREDILLSSEDNDFSDKQCKALLKSSSPLRDIFKHWEHQPTGHMEEIRESIEATQTKSSGMILSVLKG